MVVLEPKQPDSKIFIPPQTKEEAQTPRDTMNSNPVKTTEVKYNLREVWKQPSPESPYLTGLQVNNSLAGGKVPFVPVKGNVVNWYGCGPTVYDAAHMGHARNYVTFDVLRRIMEDYFGYKVNMCMNITDIDDKIIARAKELDIPFEQLSRFWENDFFVQMKKLRCKIPDVVTRVSEYIPQILTFIAKIMKNGFAYESGGSVYFDTTAFRNSDKHIYGRMEPWSVNDEARVLEGEGTLGIISEKKCPLDFALWKKNKEGEPSWDSPWGPGRPGWHIECSAMASDVLGFPLDIHSGGVDLRFPHHDNELAQTEANYDQGQWVNYFMHSGHLHIKGLKMSKSLKNFITISAMLERYSPRIIRLLSLIHRWDQPMNYDPEGASMAEPVEIDRVLSNFFQSINSLLRKVLKSEIEAYKSATDVDFAQLSGLNRSQNWTDAEKKLLHEYEVVQGQVHEALCDNFNTPIAVEKLLLLVTSLNVYITSREENEIRGPLVYKIAFYIYSILKVFGLTSESETTFEYASQSSGADESFATLMDSTAEFRHQMRENIKRLFKVQDVSEVKAIADAVMKMCDQFRDEELVNLGVKLEDKGEKGYTWKQSTKEEILLERNLKAEKAEAAVRAKEAAKLAKEQAKIAKQQKQLKQNQLK
eukprot:Blabericola_migrator_1__51@NODE_1011_length_5710_cov_146_189615_g538_i1_p1_GENE_NODE_1011_length_5710_cov_146_189615_g538_i1NODE_1011_length_5710_cov_146_189615_g538_i1_p1_ORF_typecomplete_len646_score137_09tRNAsynt_1e/PF01406_19/4_1e129tRNAsynt_1e/PF01406_19/1_2e02tRNAsynt_1g/PF09334_11/9_3e05tRNAsynt_1g/PF09334_11/5_4e05tRNAsynt_1g/PF09334_11/3e03tRNAsynt_1/PF00133_22/0_7tRNAsynt_1/PF00133_22/5_2e07tRNAsynt_1f/PF01921_18/67tRNAsynt_1f/PF01921_18/0_0017DALR_2/PF09190_11/0_00057tRNAsynt_1d/PF007